MVLILTLFSHSHFEALFQPAMLALVSVVLVDGATPRTPALVRQVSADGPLEETLTAWKQFKHTCYTVDR